MHIELIKLKEAKAKREETTLALVKCCAHSGNFWPEVVYFVDLKTNGKLVGRAASCDFYNALSMFNRCIDDQGKNCMEFQDVVEFYNLSNN